MSSWIPARTHPPITSPALPCEFLFRLNGDIMEMRDRNEVGEGRQLWDAVGDAVAFLAGRGFNLGRFRIIYWDSDEAVYHGVRVMQSRETGWKLRQLYPIGEKNLDEAERKARLVNFRQSQ